MARSSCIISTRLDSDFECSKVICGGRFGQEREFESRITVRRSFSLTSIHLKYIFILYLYSRFHTLISRLCTHTHLVTQALEIKRDQVKTKRKEQDVLFKSERKAADIMFNEKNVQALARIESENTIREENERTYEGVRFSP